MKKQELIEDYLDLLKANQEVRNNLCEKEKSALEKLSKGLNRPLGKSFKEYVFGQGKLLAKVLK